MAGNKKIVGLWQDGVEPEGVPPSSVVRESENLHAGERTDHDDAGDPLASMHHSDDPVVYDDDVQEPGDAPARWPTLVLATLIVGWTLWFLWSATSGGDTLPTATEWPNVIARWAPVAAVIALIALFLQRSSAAEWSRYGHITRGLDDANARLSSQLRTANTDLRAARQQLGEHLSDLDTHAAATLTRMEAQRMGLRAEIDACIAAETALARASDQALDRVQSLITNLPRIENVAQRSAEALGQAGTTAHRHGAALEAQMASIADQSAHVTGSVTSAVSALRDGLQRMQAAASETDARLIATTEHVGEAATAALAETRGAVEQSRLLFAEERDGLAAYVQSARQDTETTLSRVRAAAEATVDALSQSVRALGHDLDGHEQTASRITGDLDRDVAVIASQFAALAETAPADLARLSHAVDATQSRAGTLAEALSQGGERADALVVRAEQALTALEAVAREAEHSLPSAFARLDDRSATSLSALQALQPVLGNQIERAGTLVDHLSKAGTAAHEHAVRLETSDAEALAAIDRHRVAADALAERLSLLAGELDTTIAARETRLKAVVEVLRDDVDAALRGLADAADMAVADVQERLRGLGDQGFTDAMRTDLDARLATFATQSRSTLEAATQNADTLLNRLGALEASSAQVAARMREADEALAQSDRDHLASQVALLTDSLKSIAIDVTKVLSTEVTDTAWDAYLKGDRGVFARRAVRLLDTTESREIMRLYNGDAEFRGHVNHFIRDFEAMLRLLIGARDGSALSVTLLSSDIGKLYVALAQAIDRLRT